MTIPERVEFPTYETLLTEAIRSLAIDSGTVTTPAPVGTNVLQDITKSWAAKVHKNRLVKIIRGAGAGQTAIVESNIAKSLVIKGSWAVALDTTSVYVILNADLMQMLRDVFGGGSDISLKPIEKANEHNTAETANTNILAAALSPTNTPCLFRVMVAFDTVGTFRATITKEGNTQTVIFNNNVDLVADCLYMFDHLVHSGDTVNYQYSVNAQLLVLRVQEIVAGVQ